MKLFDKTTIKFLIVGAINTIVGTTVMFVSYNLLHFNYWVSSAANYIVGSIISFFLNKYFTFNNKEKSLKIILKFIINISICYLLAYGAAKPLIFKLLADYDKNIQENVAMLTGMFIFVLLNYIGQKFLVFDAKE